MPENPFAALDGFVPKNQGDQNEKPKEVVVISAPESESLVPIEPPTTLAKEKSGELMNPFALTRELFDFAVNNLPELASNYYYDSNNEYPNNPHAKKMPAHFASLVKDYPGEYYVVGYENRTGSYYRLGTRKREVVLSTVPKASTTNEAIREILISEPDPSEGKGNMISISVSDRVMEASATNLNHAGVGEVDAPHGSSTITYEVRANDSKKVVESKYDRLDEGLFEWNGNKETPVRWLRRLNANEGRLEYRDDYIIGRHQETGSDERVTVTIAVDGKVDQPTAITISLGLVIGGGKVVFEDKESGIKIVREDIAGMNAYKNQDDILKQDPNYAFLFSGSITKDQIVDLLKRKTEALVREWNKNTAVFGTTQIEGGAEPVGLLE